MGRQRALRPVLCGWKSAYLSRFQSLQQLLQKERFHFQSGFPSVRCDVGHGLQSPESGNTHHTLQCHIPNQSNRCSRSILDYSTVYCMDGGCAYHQAAAVTRTKCSRQSCYSLFVEHFCGVKLSHAIEQIGEVHLCSETDPRQVSIEYMPSTGCVSDECQTCVQ